MSQMRLIGVVLLVFLFAACKNDKAGPEAKGGSAAAATASGAAVEPESKGSCTLENTIEVVSTNGGYPKDKPIDWKIKGARAFKSEAVGQTSVYVYLATIDLPDNDAPKIRGIKLTDGQGMIRLVMTRQVAKAPQGLPFRLGKYDASKPQGAVEQTATLGVGVANETTVQLTQQLSANEIQVTHLNATEICGTIDIKDNWTSVKGSFKASLGKTLF